MPGGRDVDVDVALAARGVARAAGAAARRARAEPERQERTLLLLQRKELLLRPHRRVRGGMLQRMGVRVRGGPRYEGLGRCGLHRGGERMMVMVGGGRAAGNRLSVL